MPADPVVARMWAASAAARAAHHHFPADCLAEAAITIERLSERLAALNCNYCDSDPQRCARSRVKCCPDCGSELHRVAAASQRAAGSGRAEEHVEGAIKLGANPAEETEPIHMGWMSSFTPELQDAITAAANCPCSSYPCTCQRADQTQEGDR